MAQQVVRLKHVRWQFALRAYGLRRLLLLGADEIKCNQVRGGGFGYIYCVSRWTTERAKTCTNFFWSPGHVLIKKNMFSFMFNVYLRGTCRCGWYRCSWLARKQTRTAHRPQLPGDQIDTI